MVRFKKSFIVYGNVVLVLGSKRDGIYDLNGRAFFLAKEHSEPLKTLFDTRVIDACIYKEDNHIKNLCDVFQKRKIGKWVDSKITDCFIEPYFLYKTKSGLSNAILDIDRNSHHYEAFIQQLSDILCPFLQIRFYPDSEFRQLQDLSNLIDKHQILSAQILFPYKHTSDFQDDIANIIKDNSRIAEIVLYGTPHGNDQNNTTQHEGLKFTESIFENEFDCGKIGPDYFIPSLGFYMESLHYNTCLNGKISLDRYGFIRNCPSMNFDYGHMKNSSILEILNNEEFTKWWTITKDQIEECKDCEYRHMCSDCRAYRKNPANIFSKPLKCNYSVYK
jgi:SPASM domain peptide maturase of grasp-with-spasm system